MAGEIWSDPFREASLTIPPSLLTTADEVIE
jgi:hypothetical protein